MPTRVEVKFYLEPTDEDHSTGLTGDDYDRVTEAILETGGENIEFDVVEKK